MNKTTALIFTIPLILALPLATSSEMSSDSFRVPTFVQPGCSELISSNSFRVNLTIGQPSPLMEQDLEPASASFHVYPGFWYSTEVVINDCTGDYNNDGDVDGWDLSIFATAFGVTMCHLVYEPLCDSDFDGDGDIDGSDLAKFAQNFGRTDCLEP